MCNWYLDVFSEDENSSLPIHQMEEQHFQASLKEGACEDDRETTAPFIGMVPNESGREDGSPLDFRSDVQKHIGLINQEIDEQFVMLHLG